MKNLEELYNFYVENCVDEDKKEEALSFEEWKENHGEEELQNLQEIDEENERLINRMKKASN